MIEMELEPIYGWGWFKAGNKEAMDVPPSFVLIPSTNEKGRIVGTVKAPHILERFEVELTVRAKIESDTQYTVRAFNSDGTMEISGFAQSKTSSEIYAL